MSVCYGDFAEVLVKVGCDDVPLATDHHTTVLGGCDEAVKPKELASLALIRLP
ncbi:MAG: hypothetical protein AAFZ17_04120 [Cyanobacteria bacterium J06650_10]